MPKMQADFNTLFFQAQDSVDMYLDRAVGKIDETFGEGYAEKNPELVATLVQVYSNEFSEMSANKVKCEAADDIASALRELGYAVDCLASEE